MSLMPIGLGGALPILPGAAPGVVSLLVGGTIYEGWTEVEVRLGVRRMAGEFTLQVSERWTGGNDGPAVLQGWRIRPQDPCQVFYGGRLVMTGYVDAYNPRYSFSDHSVTIQGRTKTADLVDSSVDDEVKGGELRNQTLPQAARRVTRNFGIPVRVQGAIDETFDVMRVRPGETVHRFLERYARTAGAVMFPGADGALQIAQIEDGGGVTSLVEGVNILEASAMLRADKRHSKIKAKGQDHGTDQEHGEPVATRRSEARDNAVKRYRPLTLLGEGKTSRRNARRRAAWEAAARAGESTRVEVKVVDWMYAPGALWQPGMRVSVVSPMLAVNRVLAIESVQLSQSRSRGTIAALTLVPPEALNPKAGKKGKGGGVSGSGGGGGGGGSIGSLGLPGADSDEMWTSVKPDSDPD